MAMMMPAVPVPAMMMTLVPAVPMAMMVPVPPHFGGKLPRVLLDRGGTAGIDQRQRLRTLERRRRHEKHAHSRETQNFRSVHPHSPSHEMSLRPRRAAAPTRQTPRRDADRIYYG
jgi:hypothetical protein